MADALRTIYYDADDFRLTRWGGSLRFRLPDEWTLSLPRSAAERCAYDADHTFTGPSGAIPARALDLATAYLRGAVPRPIADLQLLGAVPRLALDIGEPPELIAPVVGPRSRVDDVVRAALIGSAQALVSMDAGMRLGAGSRAVHGARIAVRRLRSDLRTFAPMLDPVWAERLRERVRWLGDTLAAAREADVLLERLARHASRLPEVDHHHRELVLNLLRGVRHAAYQQLGDVLRQSRYVLVLADLLAAVSKPCFVEPAALRARDVAPELMDGAWRALRRSVRERERPAGDAALHTIRLRAKRVRYAAEALAPACGPQAARFAARVGSLQRVLGEYRDAVGSSEALRRHYSGGEGAFVAGELAALERDAASTARGAWLAAWQTVRVERRFWR